MNISTAVALENTASTRGRRGAVLVALAAALALLVTLLLPAHAGARTPSVPRRTPSEVAFSGKILTLLNAERAQHHLKPVTARNQLITSARGHDLAMAHANVMSHQVRGEQALGNRITKAGYTWTWAGENIGWNSAMTAAGVLMLEKAMYNELPPNDGHRKNILNAHFTNVGVDVYLDKAHDKVWLTVDFGRP